jgi:hypothetical protein
MTGWRRKVLFLFLAFTLPFTSSTGHNLRQEWA